VVLRGCWYCQLLLSILDVVRIERSICFGIQIGGGLLFLVLGTFVVVLDLECVCCWYWELLL